VFFEEFKGAVADAKSLRRGCGWFSVVIEASLLKSSVGFVRLSEESDYGKSQAMERENESESYRLRGFS
jgi:hypothetical protein